MGDDKSKIVPSGIALVEAKLSGEILATSERLCQLFLNWTQQSLSRLQLAESAALLRLNEYVPQDRLLTTAEAATYLGFSARWLDEHTRPGMTPEVPFLLIGGEKRFRKASLDHELARREIKRPEVQL